jgi:hypothetical protein
MAAIQDDEPVDAGRAVSSVPESTDDPTVARSVQAAHAAHAAHADRTAQPSPPSQPAPRAPSGPSTQPAEPVPASQRAAEHSDSPAEPAQAAARARSTRGSDLAPPRTSLRRRGRRKGKRRSSIVERRRARKKTPVVGIVLALFVAGIAGYGSYQVYTEFTKPGAGADVLGLLPESTLAAGSVERVRQLERDLGTLSGGVGRHQLEGALASFRRSAVSYLVDGLGVSHASASKVVDHTTATSFGIVPVGDGTERVILLVIDERFEPLSLLTPRPAVAERIGEQRIHRGTLYAAALGQTLVLCRSPAPIKKMIESELAQGAGSLGQVPEFVEARTAFAKEGRAWFYVSPGLPPGSAPGLAAKSVSALPAARYAAGWVTVRDPKAVVRGRLAIADKATYSQVRLAPAKLITPGCIPATADFAIAANLGDPTVTYDRLLVTLDPRLRQETGQAFSDIIRRFERSHGLFLRDELLPLLQGEIAVFGGLSPWPAFAILATVVDPDAAAPVLVKTMNAVLGTEFKLDDAAGGARWIAAGGSVVFGFVGNVLVIASSADVLTGVRAARKSGKTLAGDAAFRSAVGAAPKASLVVAARESEAARTARHGGERAMLVCLVTMVPDGIRFVATVPDVAEALIWLGATIEGTRLPAPQPSTTRPAESTGAARVSDPR